MCYSLLNSVGIAACMLHMRYVLANIVWEELPCCMRYYMYVQFANIVWEELPCCMRLLHMYVQFANIVWECYHVSEFVEPKLAISDHSNYQPLIIIIQ